MEAGALCGRFGCDDKTAAADSCIALLADCCGLRTCLAACVGDDLCARLPELPRCSSRAEFCAGVGAAARGALCFLCGGGG